MARFSDLPPELVLNILRHVDPRNLVRACILSKSIFLLAAPILKEHRRLTKEFSNAFVDTSCATSLLDCLAEVLAKPQNADYVRDLTVGFKDFDKWEEDEEISERQNQPSPDFENEPRCNLNNLQVIRTAIENTRHICTDKSDVWLQAVQHNTEDIVFTLLMVHLPNLERLGLRFMCGYASRMTQKIRDAPTSKYLCHLKHLTVEFAVDFTGYEHDIIWERSEYLKLITGFLSLPSLAFCLLSCLQIDDDESDPQRYLRPHESAILEIQFDRCSIGPKTLFEILEGAKCLSSISYTSDSSFPGLVQWKPLDWYWLAVGLWRYARHSLEKVALKPCGSVYAKLCDFREFTLLREIEAEMALLFSDNTSKAQSLPWVLPSSLRILRLRFQSTDNAQRWGIVEQIKEVIHVILKVKQVLLPYFTEIQLFNDGCLKWPPLEKTAFLGTYEACKQQGISLSLRREKYAVDEGEEFDDCCWA